MASPPWLLTPVSVSWLEHRRLFSSGPWCPHLRRGEGRAHPEESQRVTRGKRPVHMLSKRRPAVHVWGPEEALCRGPGGRAVLRTLATCSTLIANWLPFAESCSHARSESLCPEKATRCC